MAIKDKLQALANVHETPCITISFNTHRTHPANAVDPIMLKNLLKEAENRIVEEFGKRETTKLVKKIKDICPEIDENYNLDSLHIFLSDSTEEIIRIAWHTYEDKVQIGNHFDLRPLIKAYNRTDEYMILVLSQAGAHLYQAMNDVITGEIKGNDSPTDVIDGEVSGETFPFAETPWFAADMEERSKAEHMDNLLREYFNRIDKAVVDVYNRTSQPCIVICTEDNYSHLLQIADRPAIYQGHAAIDYNHAETHHIVKQAWEIVRKEQQKRRTEAINEIREAKEVLTDLQDIYQASIDGRGDLLVVYDTFSQPVIMTDERTIEPVDDPSQKGVISDITGVVAWNVLSMNGRVVFTCDEAIKEIGNIALKTRY